MTLENLIIGEEYLHIGELVKVVEIVRDAGYVVVTTRDGARGHCEPSELRQKPARMG